MRRTSCLRVGSRAASELREREGDPPAGRRRGRRRTRSTRDRDEGRRRPPRQADSRRCAYVQPGLGTAQRHGRDLLLRRRGRCSLALPSFLLALPVVARQRLIGREPRPMETVSATGPIPSRDAVGHVGVRRRSSKKRSASLPDDLRGFMSNVAVVVEDEPPAGLPLLGLSTRVSRSPHRSSAYAGRGAGQDHDLPGPARANDRRRSRPAPRPGARGSCCTRSPTTSGSPTSALRELDRY